MQYLLLIHIIAGSISLIAAAFAVLLSKGKNFTFRRVERTPGEWLCLS